MERTQDLGECLRAPLELAQRLLAAGEGLTPKPFLRELAEVFEADGAGWSEANGTTIRERLSGVEPAVPWADDPAVRVRAGLGQPLAHCRGSQQFLCGAAGAERVLWIEKAVPLSPWDELDRTAFALIGSALGRRLQQSSGEVAGSDVQQRLSDAIHVARKLNHVYSNILTSVLGFLEMSLTQTAGNPTLRRYLDVALRGTNQGVALTQRMRLLGCKATATSLGVPLLPQLTRLLGKRVLPGKTVEELLDVAHDLPPVALSSEQLTAIIEALLDNAHEAIELKGRVTISARVVTLTLPELQGLWGRPLPGQHLRIDVTDTGAGIAAATRARLFQEPFFSVKPRHHGLGLTIVHSILSAQQGGICLLEPLDGGTTVRVLLPTTGERRTML